MNYKLSTKILLLCSELKLPEILVLSLKYTWFELPTLPKWSTN